eukprot:365323-Chlamydomonas_euryale.AAC.21
MSCVIVKMWTLPPAPTLPCALRPASCPSTLTESELGSTLKSAVPDIALPSMQRNYRRIRETSLCWQRCPGLFSDYEGGAGARLNTPPGVCDQQAMTLQRLAHQGSHNGARS